MASHGVLDTFTTGGKGIALLWPFTEHRYFAPIQVIHVAPLSVSRFFSPRGITVMLSELQWVWLPSCCLAAVLGALRFWWGSRPSLETDPTKQT
jgi:inner membrane protein